MKKIFLVSLLFPFFSKAQLTVERIMQDPKWIGTSPQEIFWNYDSRSIYFKWNPDKNISDSSYSFSLQENKISKTKYPDAKLAEDISNGKYNAAKTKIVFIHNADVYLLNAAEKKILRITQTADEETNPGFLKNDNSIVYQLRHDLYTWNSITGNTEQLTHFENGNAPDENKKLLAQQKWLNGEALQTSSVIKKRKDKTDAEKKFLDSNRGEKILRTIYIHDKELQDLNLSPGGRFITYRLYEKNNEAKETVVPSYVTQDGYTKEIPARSKVGRPDGTYSFYVFDKMKDTVLEVSTDSIPAINYTPEYVKLYPSPMKDSDAVP